MPVPLRFMSKGQRTLAKISPCRNLQVPPHIIWPLIELELSIQSKAVISESKVWLDLATQSRLRIENMRTMHRLAFSSARARWTAHLVEESYKTGQASMCGSISKSHY